MEEQVDLVGVADNSDGTSSLDFEVPEDLVTPWINLVKVIDNKDGSSDLEVEVSEEFIELYKKALKKEEVTEEELRGFLVEVINEVAHFNPLDHEQTK